MNTLKGIITKRAPDIWQSWQIIFEWEDIISKEMNVPLVAEKRAWYQRWRYKFIYDKICLLYIYFCNKKSLKDKRDLFLYFQILITNEIRLAPWVQRSVIPYVIDAFIDETDLNAIYKQYALFPLIYISSIEVYNFLKEKNCPLNIEFVPLSISNIYDGNKNKEIKKFDICSAGRPNPIFEKWIQLYLIENDSVDYVYLQLEDGLFKYFSTKQGFLGVFNTREEYIQLLKNSRIALYSTPGIDGGKNTKNFNPVTPRYLELLSCQCHILARYPDTVETRFFELEKVCHHIDSYEMFKTHIEKYLTTQPYFDLYEKILSKHYTSRRIEIIKNSIEQLNKIKK